LYRFQDRLNTNTKQKLFTLFYIILNLL
jgi:hypothetical protein